MENFETFEDLKCEISDVLSSAFDLKWVYVWNARGLITASFLSLKIALRLDKHAMQLEVLFLHSSMAL